MNAQWPCVLALAASLFAVVPAAAQTTSDEGRIEVAVGVGWLGGAVLGEQPAVLRAPSGGTLRLFDSESELASTTSFDVRVGWALTPRFALEGRAALSHPELRTAVSNDFENALPGTLVERLDQYIFDGGVSFRLSGSGLRPFVSGGVGYLRQLHEEQALVEEGHLFYAGGGFLAGFFSRSQGFIRSAGIRADFRLDMISGGIEDDGYRSQGSVAGSFVVTF